MIQTVSSETKSRLSYQHQYRKCGKASCKTCQQGQGHGPYWYAYWRDAMTRRVKSRYIGKTLPEGVVIPLKGELNQKHVESVDVTNLCATA